MNIKAKALIPLWILALFPMSSMAASEKTESLKNCREERSQGETDLSFEHIDVEEIEKTAGRPGRTIDSI